MSDQPTDNDAFMKALADCKGDVACMYGVVIDRVTGISGADQMAVRELAQQIQTKDLGVIALAVVLADAAHREATRLAQGANERHHRIAAEMSDLRAELAALKVIVERTAGSDGQ